MSTNLGGYFSGTHSIRMVPNVLSGDILLIRIRAKRKGYIECGDYSYSVVDIGLTDYLI